MQSEVISNNHLSAAEPI